MASSICSHLSLLVLLPLLLLHHATLSTQLQVSSSAIYIAKLTLLCGSSRQGGGGDQQQQEGEPAVPPGLAAGTGAQEEEGTAGGVSRQWLRFLESLRAAQSTGVHVQPGVQQPTGQYPPPAQDGVREDPGGRRPAATDTSTPTAPGGIPAFLRAVRRGHVMSDVSSQNTAFWNMTAVKGQEDVVHEGEYIFNLHFIHVLHHRYVEVVFSPTNYHSNESQEVCTFTFCDEQKTVCATLNSNVRSNGSLFYTVPTRFVFGTVISSFSRSIVKLVSVTCGQTKIQMEGNDRWPLLAFFQTKQLADTVNTFALAGWQRLDDQEDVGNFGERKRRSTQSTKAPSSKENPQFKEMTDMTCGRHTWIVTARDLGWEGEMLDPVNGMEVGYCRGDCSKKQLVIAHAILRVRYIEAALSLNEGGYIQPASCVPTRLLPQSAVLLMSNDRYDIRTLPSIKVTQCECR